MKNLFVVLVILILLSGCISLREHLYPTTTEGTTTSTVETTTTTTTKTTSSTTTTAISEFKYPELRDCEKLRKRARDDCYYDIAVDKGDFSLCEEIENNLLRTVCLAAKKKETKICDLIDDSETKDKCYYGVAITKNDEKICGYIDLQILKDTCYLKISKSKKKKKICDNIRFPTIKNICLSDCVIREVSSDMIGTVGKDDPISVTIKADRCKGLKVSYKMDSDYLSLIEQSTSTVSEDYEEIFYEFMCQKDKAEIYLYLKVGDEKITKKAACRTFIPAVECSIQLLVNESKLDSRVTENVYVTILAENCKDKEVSDYVKPEYLKFVNWCFNGVSKERKSNKIKSDLEKINISYECTEMYDGILLRIGVGGEEINRYITCRKKPECSLKFLEEKSKLEGRIGESVYLTVIAEECKGKKIEGAAQLYQLSFVNRSTNIVESNREEIRTTYRCERASDLSLFIRLSVGTEDVVRYVRCRP